VFSAGLCRTWQRTTILENYPHLLKFQNVYRCVDEQLVRSREMFWITNIERLAALLSRYPAREVVIATAHHGHFIAFMNTCARHDVPLAVCYKAASTPYLDSAKRNGLKLINLGAQRSVLSLFDVLDQERANGRYIAIMMDGPFPSRKRYNFLGYQVEASALAPVYAKKNHLAILPLVSSLSADLRFNFAEGLPIEKACGETAQELLNFLQSIILLQPLQYQWTSNSILMSDRHARNNAITYLQEALAWRECQL